MSIDTPSTDAEAESSSSTPRTGSTTFINTSGGLLTDELVSKLRQRHCGESAVRPETFALPNTELPEEADIEAEIGNTWDTLRERWDELTMDETLFHMDISDARTKWILKLFQNLGFEPVFQRENLEAGGIEANLSHKGWPDGEIESYSEMEGRTAPIIHTVEPEQKLDEKPEDAPRGAKSPHDTLQEFLNASDEHDWAVVTNGLTLRILRDFYHTYTRGYVEFDLENLFTNRNYGDFRALYRLCHASRFIEPVVAEEDDEVEIPLEKLYQVALSTGVKVGQDLQENVVSALETLGNGFLDVDIEKALEEGGQETAEDYYQDLLYVVYRLLFLMFTEQRGMMSQRDSLYTEEYSITKLRERAEQREEGDRNTDLWEGLKATFRLAGEGDKSLGVPGYNGALFDDDNLEFVLDAECPNEKLLSAVHDLTHIKQGGYQQRISYADLGVEEIGAVYESLLEFTPQLAETVIELEDRTISSDSFYLDDRGMERKETGSFYTDPALVDELVQSALKPVVEDRVDDGAPAEEQAQELLDITVCDPACGSGAFLIAANNFLAQRLAEIRSDSRYPDERTIRQARRSVVQQCIYGVDLNPMAAELAKVSLWINSAVEDKPLNFLDHRIKQGNSLVGTTRDVISQGVPVDAYETSKGRDWHKGNKIRKRVRQENDEVDNQQQQVRLDRRWGQVDDDYVSLAEKLDQLEEGEIGDIQEKEEIYHKLRENKSFQREKLAYDVWTAAFYWPLDGSADEYPTPNTIERIRRDPPEPSDAPLDELTGLQDLRERASRIADEQSFFHWPLEFPAVYKENGGFECMLGNPPWDTLEMNDEEFFAVLKPEIVSAGTQAKRKKKIDELEETDPELHSEYKKRADAISSQSEYIKKSGRYPLTGSGKINTYAPFTELTTSEISNEGRAGIVVPTGIATSSTTQEYFREIVDTHRLISIFDFVNKKGLFPGVDGRYKFSLFTVGGENIKSSKFDMGFHLTDPEQLQGDDDATYSLTLEDIELINPNTKNCPTFHSKEDAELVKSIYQDIGVLIRTEEQGGNNWGIDLWTMFRRSDDSGLFKTRDELKDEGWELIGNEFQKGNRRYIPLYEPKYIDQYDHRFATYEGVPPEDVENTGAKQIPKEKKDEGVITIPRFWVPESDYVSKSGSDWHFSLRNITNSSNKRTVIGAVLPEVATDHNFFLSRGEDAKDSLLLLACLNSFTLDFVARQKVDNYLSSYIIKQFPVPSPDRFEDVTIDGEPLRSVVEDLTLKLLYNNSELETFVDDAGYDLEPYSFSTPGGRSREEIRFQLEAIITHLYGIKPEDFSQLFKSFDQIRRRDQEEYGYYRTRDEIKKRFEELAPRINDTSEEDQ